MRDGGAGYRSRYLSHAKRALYHLSYAPDVLATLTSYTLFRNRYFDFHSRNNNGLAPDMKKLTCRYPVSNLQPLFMAKNRPADTRFRTCDPRNGSILNLTDNIQEKCK